MKTKLLFAIVFCLGISASALATVDVEIIVDLSLTGKTPLNASIITNTGSTAPSDFHGMTDIGNGFWKYTVTVADATKLNYYFYFWDGTDNWETVPEGCRDDDWFRSITVGSGGTFNRNHTFASCIEYTDTSRVNVNFEVDMTIAGHTTPSMLLGTPSGDEFISMTAVSGTSKYSYTVSLPANSTGPFAFDDDGSYPIESIYDACKTWPASGSFMRFFTVGTSDTTITLPYELCSVTSWSGGVWSNGTPDANALVVVGQNLSLDQNYSIGQLKVESGNTLSITSNNTLQVNDDMINDGEVDVSSGGSLITYSGSSSTGSGTFVLKRSTRYANGRYSFVGTLVNEDMSITGASLGSTVYGYDESEDFDVNSGLNRWKSASSQVLVPGVGFAQAFQKDLSFQGIPNSGEIRVTGLTHTAAGASQATNRGWNLVSNPYPAAIDLTSFLNYNNAIDASIYLWDDHGSDKGRGDNSDYLIANSIGVVAGPNGGEFNGYIGAAQGFFVRLSDNVSGDTVVFTEDMRVTNFNADSTFFRQGEEGSFKIALNNVSREYGETLVGFRSDATLGADRKYDALLLGEQATSIYSIVDDQAYAIQGTPLSETQRIKLGLATSYSSFLTMSFSDFKAEGLPGNWQLIDKDLNQVIDIDDQTIYQFESKGTVENDRFELVRMDFVSGVQENKASTSLWSIAQEENVLTIRTAINANYSVSLIDIKGNVISNNEEVHGDLSLTTDQLNTGIYILKLFENEHSLVRKIMID